MGVPLRGGGFLATTMITGDVTSRSKMKDRGSFRCCYTVLVILGSLFHSCAAILAQSSSLLRPLRMSIFLGAVCFGLLGSAVFGASSQGSAALGARGSSPVLAQGTSSGAIASASRVSIEKVIPLQLFGPISHHGNVTFFGEPVFSDSSSDYFGHTSYGCWGELSSLLGSFAITFFSSRTAQEVLAGWCGGVFCFDHFIVFLGDELGPGFI